MISDKDLFENNNHIHVYSPEAGTHETLESKLLINTNLLLIWSIAASVLHLMTLLQFSP